MKNIFDIFFTHTSPAYGIDEEEYKKLPVLFNTLNNIGPVADLGFYIIDYYKQKVIFMSDNITKWSGITIYSTEQNGIDFISEKDMEMLEEINGAFFDILKTRPSEEYTKLSLSYNFRIFTDKVKYLVHQTFSPLEIRNGKIWLGLCTITLSSRSSTGNILIRQKDSRTIYRYSLEKHTWTLEESINLSDIEKLIIRYSAQGLSNEQIADKLLKSIDSVKSYKKKMYKKMKVHTMAEAIVYSQNQCLL